MYKHLLTHLTFAFVYEAQAVTIDNDPIQLAQTSAEFDWSSLLAILNRRPSSS